jgi:hypothetical protein
MRCLAFCALAAACTTTDDRPQTLAYVTETILVPNCATAECHSSLRAQDGYVFDTVEHTQDSLADANDQTGFRSIGALITPGDPMNSPLVSVLNGQNDFVKDENKPLMPLDHPLANKDIFFIAKWIENGAAGYELAP